MLGLGSGSLVPLTALLVVIGPIGIPLLLGERWTPAAGPLTILAVAALIRGLLELARPILLGVGRSKDDFILKAFQLIVLLGLLLPAANDYGTIGVAWAVLIAAAAALPVGIWLVRNASGAHPRDFVGPVIPPLVAGASGLFVMRLTPLSTTWWSLISAAALFLVVYALVTVVLLRAAPRWGVGLGRSAAR